MTRGAIAAVATDMADPAQATALGIRRAAALEHPDWHPTLIDLDREYGSRGAGERICSAIAVRWR